MKGKVVSTKMNKTVVVEVERWVNHPIYKKRMKKNRRFAVHSETKVNHGDIVELKEVKPISKTKNFVIAKVLEKTTEVEKNDSE